jgi:hypothetical protein
MLVVKASPKRKIPTHTAVTGSIAPNTEVSVEPMLFTALTRARLETTVGIKANRIKLPFADGLKLADGFRSDKKENTSEKEYVESKQ